MSAPADGCQSLCCIMSHKKVGSLVLLCEHLINCRFNELHFGEEQTKSTFAMCTDIIHILFNLCFFPVLLGGGHALEDRWPIPPSLCMQRPMPCRWKEESGKRSVLLLALWALWGIPLSGKALEEFQPSRLVVMEEVFRSFSYVKVAMPQCKNTVLQIKVVY